MAEGPQCGSWTASGDECMPRADTQVTWGSVYTCVNANESLVEKVMVLQGKHDERYNTKTGPSHGPGN